MKSFIIWRKGGRPGGAGGGDAASDLLSLETSGARALVTLMLAGILALSAPTSGAPFQVLAGPAFERFAARAERFCPSAHPRFIKPADLDDVESGFREGLSAADRAKIDAAIPRSVDGGPRAWQGRNGLSCASTFNLKAIERAQLLQRFIAFLCVHPAPP